MVFNEKCNKMPSIILQRVRYFFSYLGVRDQKKGWEPLISTDVSTKCVYVTICHILKISV